jgi:hypothetical protein
MNYRGREEPVDAEAYRVLNAAEENLRTALEHERQVTDLERRRSVEAHQVLIEAARAVEENLRTALEREQRVTEAAERHLMTLAAQSHDQWHSAVAIELTGRRISLLGFSETTPFSYNEKLQTQQHVVRELPSVLASSVLLLDRKNRDEVLADLQDWYQEIAETRGLRSAKFFVIMKLLSALGGQVLCLAERVAGIMGKFRGQRKTE